MGAGPLIGHSFGAVVPDIVQTSDPLGSDPLSPNPPHPWSSG